MWSAGNGGVWKDSCAYDGYVNSIYTIAVNAVAKNGDMLYSTEKCSAIMVASYSKNKADKYPIVSSPYYFLKLLKQHVCINNIGSLYIRTGSTNWYTVVAAIAICGHFLRLRLSNLDVRPQVVAYELRTRF